MRENILNWIGYVALLLAFVCLAWYATWREARINALAEEYEACVFEQYGQHPVTWYLKHGEYPPCQNQ